MTWDEVGEGCFRRRYRAFDLNIGVVRGSDALLVVDTRADLRQADELLDDLAVFGRPVRWVVNSHWHFDHTFGNQRFVERAGAHLELWGHADLPAALLDDAGDLRARLRERYGEEAGDEYDRVVLTPPDRLVVDHQLLDLGDRGVELAHSGLGHTDNDLVVSVPDGHVAFAGDLLEESAPPAYGHDSHPLEWPATARALLDAPTTTFVPGHGDVMTRSTAEQQVDDIQLVATLIRELHHAKVAVDDALDAAAGRWPFPPAVLRHAVRRGYRSLGLPGHQEARP